MPLKISGNEVHGARLLFVRRASAVGVFRVVGHSVVRLVGGEDLRAC